MNSKLLLTLMTIFFLSIMKGQNCAIIELAVANISCNGNNDGKIVLDHTIYCASPVTYSWAHGASGNSIYNLSPGLYEVTLTASNGYQIEKNWFISEPDAIDIDASIYNVTCNGQADGSIYVSVNGGTYPFTYNWSNGSTNSYVYDASPGNYTVTVTDYNYCTGSATFTIGEPDPVSIQVDLFDNITCPGENDGHIIVSGQGGTTDSGTSMVDYFYEWSTGDYNITELENLSPGLYSVTVSDYYFCSATMNFSIYDPTQIFVTFPNITDLICYNDNSGSIEINASGGTGNLTYSWSNGTSGNLNSNLQAGTYTLTITDENDCIFTDTYTVNEPSAIIESPADLVNLSCYQDGTGEIEVFFSGGTGNLNYQWSNGATSSDLQNLQAGSYDLTVTDENDCTFLNTYILSEPSPIFVTSPTINDVDCFGNQNGSIEVNPGGGTPNFSYSWSNGGNSNTLSNVSGGSYTLTITDANGCTYMDTYVVYEPSPIFVTGPTINDVDCFGNQNGSIEVNPGGGTPDYSYAWSNGGNSNTLSNVSGGSYTLTITDANGCTFSDVYDILEPAAMATTNLLITDVECNGDDSGSISLDVEGGTPEYSYVWSNGSASDVNTNLTSGSYTLTITDDNGCTLIESFTIEEPEIMSATVDIVDVECGNENTGSLSVTMTGGTPTYSFEWSTGETTNSIADLASGNYSLIVTDAYGCTMEGSYFVAQPGDINIESASIENNDCPDAESGTINLDVSGGNGNLSFSWSNGLTSPAITDLSAGIYIVTISDENGCNLVEQFEITSPSVITASALVIDPVLCFGEENGQITFLPSGGTSPFYVEWTYYPSNGGQPQVFENENVSDTISQLFGSGTVDIKITDNNNCLVEIETIAIEEPSQISYSSPIILDVKCNGEENGNISFIIDGGTNPFAVEWTYTPNEGSETYVEWTYNVVDTVSANYGAGTIQSKITDANGCTIDVETIIINEPQVISYSDVKVIAPACAGDTSGMVSFLVAGGSSPYAVEWTYVPSEGGETFVKWTYNVTDTVFSNFPSGIVNPIITDAAGCQLALETITISDPEPLEFSALNTNDALCYGDTSGMVSFLVAGGSSPFAVEWTYIPLDGSGNTVSIESSETGSFSKQFAAGQVKIAVEDMHGCLLQLPTQSINIKNEIIVEQLEIIQPECGQDSSGIVTISLSGGASPYAVEWTYTPTEGSEIFVEWTYNITGLAKFYFSPGTLNAIIQDSNGCIFSLDEIILENLDGPEIQEIKVTYNNGYGNIELVIDDATDDMIFEWSGTDGFSSTEQNVENLKPGIYSCIITDKNGCKTLTGNIDVIITSTVEINDSEHFSINTLSNGLLVIATSNTRNSQMTCLDIHGNRIHQQELFDGENIIGLSNIPSGIYIVMIHSEDQVFSQLISKF